MKFEEGFVERRATELLELTVPNLLLALLLPDSKIFLTAVFSIVIAGWLYLSVCDYKRSRKEETSHPA